MLLDEMTEEPLSGMTLLYGPASTGKSTLCLLALRGRSVYVSTNKNFNVERLHSVRADADVILAKLALLEPGDLLSLEKAVLQAVTLSAVSDVIVVDSLATFVRSADRKMGNLALHRILKNLERAKCPVIVTSEVYDHVTGGRELGFVGGDMLRLAARTVVELHNGAITLKKHPLHTGRSWQYSITTAGLEKQ